MNRGLVEVEKRLRVTYLAVAATTVLGAEQPDSHLAPPQELPGVPGGPRRPHRLLTGAVMVFALIAGVVATVASRQSDRGAPETAQVATQPSTTVPYVVADPAPGPGAEATCGSQLPRPLDLPDGYDGPVRMASSLEGQLLLAWSSPTGSIEARWPADPDYRRLLGQEAPVASVGEPTVSSSASIDATRQRADGSYYRTIVFGLRNVAPECRSLQIDVVDRDVSRMNDGIARLSNRGLFVSNVALVAGSEERPVAPTVISCNAPTGAVVPPNRGGPVTQLAVHPTPTDALKAFLGADSRLARDHYLEVRLPDGSIAYAKEMAMAPGSFVTVIHVARVGTGWAVDHWEASGC